MINIVLYEPEIPQNTGNIMRTCVGMGARLHLIEPLGFKLDTKYIKRSGVNYIDKCEYFVYKNWDDFISKNKGEFFFITRYGKHSPDEFNMKLDNIYLIFGKESTGIPKELLSKNLNRCVRIPTNGNIRALNLSNCVAIVLYEALRQQKYNDLSKVELIKGENYLEL